MKSYLIAAILIPLFIASCEQKSVTVNPPDNNKTTIIKEAPVTKEKTTETTIGPDGKVIEKKETIEVK